MALDALQILYLLTYLCSKLSVGSECLNHEVELHSCEFSRSGETFQCICSAQVLLDDILRRTKRLTRTYS